MLIPNNNDFNFDFDLMVPFVIKCYFNCILTQINRIFDYLNTELGRLVYELALMNNFVS